MKVSRKNGAIFIAILAVSTVLALAKADIQGRFDSPTVTAPTPVAAGQDMLGMEGMDMSGTTTPTPSPSPKPGKDSEPLPVKDTGKTGIPVEKNGHRYPTDPSGCAWYADVVENTVCVPNPLPKHVVGKAACDYLRTQGFGPVHVLKGKDPLQLDDNGDSIGCYGGDFGAVPVPPDNSGGSIV